MQKQWVAAISLSIIIGTATLKAYAQQQMTSLSANVQELSGPQLLKEMQALLEQERQIYAQLEELRAKILPLQEQLRTIREKITADHEKIEQLRASTPVPTKS